MVFGMLGAALDIAVESQQREVRVEWFSRCLFFSGGFVGTHFFDGENCCN